MSNFLFFFYIFLMLYWYNNKVMVKGIIYFYIWLYIIDFIGIIFRFDNNIVFIRVIIVFDIFDV